MPLPSDGRHAIMPPQGAHCESVSAAKHEHKRAGVRIELHCSAVVRAGRRRRLAAGVATATRHRDTLVHVHVARAARVGALARVL